MKTVAMELIKSLPILAFTSTTLVTTLVTALMGFSQPSRAQAGDGFYCNTDGEHPRMMAVSDGREYMLITFSWEWAPRPYTPQTRCETVAARFNAVYLRGGESFQNLAFGYINNQPVMCLASSQGQSANGCNPRKLLLTFPNELEGCLFLPEFLKRLASQGVGNMEGFNTQAFNQECQRRFGETAQRRSTRQEQADFVAFFARSSNSATTPAPPPLTTPVNVVLQENGRLDRRSQTMDDGSRYEVYEFSGRAGQTIGIALESNDFDTYLLLIDPNGRKIAENDDANSNTLNSLIVQNLPRTGTYRIVANALDESGLGQYRLTVLSDTASPQAARSTQEVRNPSTNFILQQQGRLDTSAPILDDGSPYHTYEFRGQRGQSIVIDLASTEFNTYLILLDPEGRKIAENDDTNDRTHNSSLRVNLPTTGVYRVIVNSYDRTGLGQYLLTVR